MDHKIPLQNRQLRLDKTKVNIMTILQKRKSLEHGFSDHRF